MSPLVVAAIDCGTNSIRLYVARATEAGLVELHREMRIVRLGQGVDATGEFAAEALERVRVALDDYVATARELGATRVRMVATSAARDVANRDVFFALTEAALAAITPGARAEVIAGTEEAELSYLGATVGLAAADPTLVVDLGGGSTELVVGSDGAVAHAFSADIGCVRITERALHSDPPTAAEIATATGHIDAALDEATGVVPLDGVRTWIGVAGTFTTLAALAHGLSEYDPALIHGSRVPLDDLTALCHRLLGMTSAERLALGPMHPGRADVIGGGALVALRLAARLGAVGVTELVVSEHDILDGVAMGLAAVPVAGN
ncbi:exopolyphosphatase / guanosine-5'-triphosphate,3'-diphosphate pyrophosphatase [Tsukamurella pulmonis]|uniref:Exopolyphosphatase / guanosine-5'-triphosphate,3'-diphosphate pyrophosphatase n=1 Tax=Tsukamurella pulmonis TaxID=47312 RepID=A0A1H1CNV4_9ACTN|nr:Ppx/GppA phosphatase family protein [Tsukamurella pulmonis]SDQ65890.1 exopolyphosphatase / guanosine-5'-triphosphate,3'-diphosphate pyrophosphatase [Tsukamurella pulmonis]SUP23396.1 Guanosine-5'-triphosphate,3'-diphosphate pyrophosphatase [Tsukamurella pulmonis]